MIRRRPAQLIYVLAVLVLLVPVLVLCGSVASAKTVDVSGKDATLPDFDISYVSSAVTDKVPASDEKEFTAELEAQWEHCDEVMKHLKTDASWSEQSDGFLVDNTGTCSPSGKGTIGGPDMKFSSLDLTALADGLAKKTSQYVAANTAGKSVPGVDSLTSALAAAKRARVAGQTASDTAKDAGASGVVAAGANAAGQAASLGGATQSEVNAVTNPSTQVDKLINSLKSDSGETLTKGLGYVSNGMAFDASLESFRKSYAVAAGVGVVLLAMMSVVSIVRFQREQLPLSEVVQRWFVSLMGGMLGLLFTPAFLYLMTSTSDVLSKGVINWMGTNTSTMESSLMDPFHAMTTANSPLGTLGAIVIFVLAALVGIALLAVFAMQYVGSYFGGVGLGVMWGFIMSPDGRRRLKHAGLATVGLVIARPILLFMIGVTAMITSDYAPTADGWSSDPMGTMFRLAIAMTALLMVCLAPGALVKYMPVAPTGAMGSGLGAGTSMTALGAGSVVGGMLGSRMAQLAPSVRGGGRRVGNRVAGNESRGGGAGARAQSRSTGAGTPSGAASPMNVADRGADNPVVAPSETATSSNEAPTTGGSQAYQGPTEASVRTPSTPRSTTSTAQGTPSTSTPARSSSASRAPTLTGAGSHGSETTSGASGSYQPASHGTSSVPGPGDRSTGSDLSAWARARRTARQGAGGIVKTGATVAGVGVGVTGHALHGASEAGRMMSYEGARLGQSMTGEDAR